MLANYAMAALSLCSRIRLEILASKCGRSMPGGFPVTTFSSRTGANRKLGGVATNDGGLFPDTIVDKDVILSGDHRWLSYTTVYKLQKTEYLPTANSLGPN